MVCAITAGFVNDCFCFLLPVRGGLAFTALFTTAICRCRAIPIGFLTLYGSVPFISDLVAEFCLETITESACGWLLG